LYVFIRRRRRKEEAQGGVDERERHGIRSRRMEYK